MAALTAALLTKHSETLLPLTDFGGEPLELFEYVALKQEQTTRISLRETALYANLAVNATMLAGLLSASSKLSIPVILAVPYVSAIMFWIYFNNDYYVTTISEYIRGYLAGRLRQHILKERSETTERREETSARKFDVGDPAVIDLIFAWETFHRQRSWGRVLRQLAAGAVLFLSFLTVPIVTLIVFAPPPAAPLIALIEWIGGVATLLLVGVGISGLSFRSR